MTDRRIIHVELEDSIGWRSAEIEGERRVAIADLLAANRFAPQRTHADGYAGPYHLRLACAEGRLGLQIDRADGRHLETLVLALGAFRRPIRDYFAICDSYRRAVRDATPQRIEPVDMARRAIHNEGADLLQGRLKGKIDVDFETARRLFTLICALHLRA